MPRLLYSPLVRFIVLARLHPLVDVGPLLSVRSQLSRQDEVHRELHHNVRRCDVITAQELSLR